MNYRIRRHTITAAALLLLAAVSFAQTAPAPQHPMRELKTCRITGHPPVVDGNLNEPAWDSCSGLLSDGFTQREPDEGKPATESTKVAVLYDDDALYVAFWCYDSDPQKIKGELVRRDRSSQSDYVKFQIDPFHDLQTGFEFAVTAAGVLSDARLYNDNLMDASWDGVWDGNVRRQPWGYTVEMRVPYHCLRFSRQPSQVWGVNFARVIIRKNESARWCFSPLSDGGYVSRFGRLVGLENIHPVGHLEVMPYGLSSTETSPASIRNKDGRTNSSNSGVDIKYGVTSDLVLDATINPDFGQVELDEPVLNLSSYETFYSEKRPFFMEGANLFETNYNVFYSRRIGRRPGYSGQSSNYAYYDPTFSFETDRPNFTTILGAGRLTGKVGPRTTIAVLTALTSQEKAEYGIINQQVNGSDTLVDTTYARGIVEPRGGYSVFRVKQDILKNSSVGGILTVASQDRIHPASTGGIDGRFNTNNGMWTIGTQAVFSRVDPVKTGYGFDLYAEKIGGKHYRGSMSVRINSPDLSLNRMGYQTRKGGQMYSWWLQYRTTDDWWIIRNSYNNINFWTNWNYDGIVYSVGGNFNTNIDFTNGWYGWGSFEVQAEKYSDEETRGNGLWIWPVYPTSAAHMGFNTDQRKPLSFNMALHGGSDRGGPWWGLELGTLVKPRSNIECNIWANVNRYSNSVRWLANEFSDDYGRAMSLFGTLDYDRLSFGMSSSLLFRRNLSLQASAEGTINGLDYSDYRYYLGDNRYSDPLANRNEDYNYSALNTMLLVRWEYMPGSTLFLVWTRSRDEQDYSVNDFKFSRDFRRLFSAGSTNVFLIKMSYWLNV
jgi:hypothetical protein